MPPKMGRPKSENPLKIEVKARIDAKTNEKLILVGGAMGTGVLSLDEIKRLATIPSMDELRAKIIGLLQAPGAALARVTKAYSEKEAA